MRAVEQFLLNRWWPEKELEKNLRWFGFNSLIEGTYNSYEDYDKTIIRTIHHGQMKDTLRNAKAWMYDWPRISLWHIERVFSVVRKVEQSEQLEENFARVFWKMKNDAVHHEYTREGLPQLTFSDYWSPWFARFDEQEKRRINRK